MFCFQIGGICREFDKTGIPAQTDVTSTNDNKPRHAKIHSFSCLPGRGAMDFLRCSFTPACCLGRCRTSPGTRRSCASRRDSRASVRRRVRPPRASPQAAGTRRDPSAADRSCCFHRRFHSLSLCCNSIVSSGEAIMRSPRRSEPRSLFYGINTTLPITAEFSSNAWARAASVSGSRSAMSGLMRPCPSSSNRSATSCLNRSGCSIFHDVTL